MKLLLVRTFNLKISRKIFLLIVQKVFQYMESIKSIGWQNAYHDIFSVTRKLRLFLLFQVFGAFAFVLLSQGKDVLQCLLEDIYGNKWIPFVFLLAGTWFWSLSGEFGARMLLHLTDSNNNGIGKKRYDFRTETQHMILGAQAIFPFVLYIFALTQVFITNFDVHHYKVNFIFTLLIVALLLNLNAALHFYFAEGRRSTYFRPDKKFQQFIISKLDNILVQDKSILGDFPGEIEPAIYKEIDPKQIRLFFRQAFPSLYRWCIIYFLITLALFFIIGFVVTDTVYYKMGTAGLMAVGFTCWLSTFYLLKVFELTEPFVGKFKKLNLPYTGLAFIWILIVSFTNKDHPIYFNEGCCTAKPTLGPKEYFNAWHKKPRPNLRVRDSFVAFDTTKFNAAYLATLSASQKKARHIKKVSILFVSAEGGALRTGGFTTLLLGAIQDKDPDFKNKLFAYSTVSGGTFGANLFNVTAYEKNLKMDSLLPLYEEYYKSVDFLAPVAAKLFFGDFINYFLPFYVEKLDRQVALETAWRNSWRSYLSNSEDNLLAQDFYTAAKTDGSRPAVFINSTVVEKGNRAILSNMKLDTSYFKEIFDLNEKIKRSISYATAIGLSARFPLVSPAGKLQMDDSYKLHFADGGYFDNQGGTTLYELLNGLTFNPETDSVQVIPYVLQTVFDDEKSPESKGVNMLNEFNEIITGIYQTRNGHTLYADKRLKEKITRMGGEYLTLPVANSTEEIPNNWVLSSLAVKCAHTRVINLLSGSGEKEGDKLILFLDKLNQAKPLPSKACCCCKCKE